MNESILCRGDEEYEANDRHDLLQAPQLHGEVHRRDKDQKRAREDLNYDYRILIW